MFTITKATGNISHYLINRFTAEYTFRHEIKIVSCFKHNQKNVFKLYSFVNLLKTFHLVATIFYRTKVLLLPYLLILCFCLIIKVAYSRETIYFYINSLHFAAGDVFFKYFTFLGDGITVITLSLILAAFSYRYAFLMITSYAVTSFIAQALKRLFDAPRPSLYFKDALSKIYFVKGVELHTLHSFPSGHTVTIFSAAIVGTYLVKNKAWGIFFFLIALLVGYSRMYLSAHFFEDVVAGSVVGIIVTLMWVAWIDKKPFLHQERWKKGFFYKRAY
jgi:membrane-associated phospholipid phosphatase